MIEQRPVPITQLTTGVPGLDAVLGGGLPEYSFNLITGIPGSGKTTLAQQIMFANASPERPALYFIVMGEPPMKMLRYQQQFRFFDAGQVGTSIRFINLSEVVIERGLDAVLERITQAVAAVGPGLVFVDSFQAIIRVATTTTPGPLDLQSFVQQLAVQLTTWQATTFLVGEALNDDLRNNPMMTIADGIFTLSQYTDRNSMVRKLQIMKLRGMDPMPGQHTLRITAAGVQVFPRMSIAITEAERVRPEGRTATGVPGLDELLDGGFPTGDAVLISGPSGAGKSVLATQFIATGVRQGEPGVIAVFEEHPKEYLRRATRLGFDLEVMEQQGTLRIIYLRPLDLSPDETLHAIRDAVEQIGARRVAIDSVSGFELALAPSFREDFRESLYRLVGALTGTGITVLMTMEIQQTASDLRFSPYVVSFLTDNIILLRYVEVAGSFRKSLVVVKMRNSAHSTDLRLYEITPQGMVVREPLQGVQARPGGAEQPRETPSARYPGLTDQEMVVLEALVALGQATAAMLAQRSGLAEGVILTATLERLVSLRYAEQVDESGQISYRPLAQVAR